MPCTPTMMNMVDPYLLYHQFHICASMMFNFVSIIKEHVLVNITHFSFMGSENVKSELNFK